MATEAAGDVLSATDEAPVDAEAEKRRAANRKKRERAKAKKLLAQSQPVQDREANDDSAALSAEPSTEVSEASAGQPDAEAAKRRDANRKKKQRAKAKKKAAAAAAATAPSGIALNAERREAGPGRGMGMFALNDIAKGDLLTRSRPAISVVFDVAARHLCSYCFRAADGPPCQSCSRFVTCAECAPLASWHSHECTALMALPASTRDGPDTSMLRMALRYKATLEHGEWCGDSPAATVAKGKEELVLLETLQAMDTTGGRQLPLKQLAALAGLPESTCQMLVHRVRNNAAALTRGGTEAGCALSVYMGYTNHSCSPNTVARIEDDGFVCLTAVKPIPEGEEALICYVDDKLPLDERRAKLAQHYGFTCDCERCKRELRQKLRDRTGR